MKKEIWNKLPKSERIPPEIEIGKTHVVVVLPIYPFLTPDESSLLVHLENVCLASNVRDDTGDDLFREILVLAREDCPDFAISEIQNVFGDAKFYEKVC